MPDPHARRQKDRPEARDTQEPGQAGQPHEEDLRGRREPGHEQRGGQGLLQPVRQSRGDGHADGPADQASPRIRIRDLRERGRRRPGLRDTLPHHQEQEGRVQKGPAQGGRATRCARPGQARRTGRPRGQTSPPAVASGIRGRAPGRLTTGRGPGSGASPSPSSGSGGGGSGYPGTERDGRLRKALRSARISSIGGVGPVGLPVRAIPDSSGGGGSDGSGRCGDSRRPDGPDTGRGTGSRTAPGELTRGCGSRAAQPLPGLLPHERRHVEFSGRRLGLDVRHGHVRLKQLQEQYNGQQLRPRLG